MGHYPCPWTGTAQHLQGSSTTSPNQACSMKWWRYNRWVRQTIHKKPKHHKIGKIKLSICKCKMKSNKPKEPANYQIYINKGKLFNSYINQVLTLSLNFSCGTGTPHLRSLVMHRDLSPSLSHAYVVWIAFWLQDPATDMSLIYSSNLSFNSGSSRNKWSVSRIHGLAWHTCWLQLLSIYKTRECLEEAGIYNRF